VPFRTLSTPPQQNIPIYRNSEISYTLPIRLILRGDRVVVLIASRACGGRGSVGREGCGQGGVVPGELAAARGRTALLGFVSSVSFRRCRRSWENCGEMAGRACGPGRRCYGQALANAALASTGAVPVTFARVREARRNSAPGRARHKPSDHRAGKAE